MSSVLVVGEVQDGEVQAVTHELTATGRKLADAGGGSVSVALMGGEVDAGLADSAIAHGADKVFLVEDTNLAGPVWTRLWPRSATSARMPART